MPAAVIGASAKRSDGARGSASIVRLHYMRRPDEPSHPRVLGAHTKVLSLRRYQTLI
ncbi:protein of unknown function (plasmid) [Caballeronia sp. S22]